MAEGTGDVIMGFCRLCELYSSKESWMSFYLKHEKEEKSVVIRCGWSLRCEAENSIGTGIMRHIEEMQGMPHKQVTYLM